MTMKETNINTFYFDKSNKYRIYFSPDSECVQVRFENGNIILSELRKLQRCKFCDDECDSKLCEYCEFVLLVRVD